MKRIILILSIIICQFSFGTDFHAIIVGISKYKNLPANWQLKYADADAKSMYDFLTSHMDIKPENTKLILNEKATAPYVKKEMYITLLKNAKKDDFVYLFFAGHGDVDSKINDGFLLMSDVESNQDYFISDALAISELKSLVDRASHRGVNVVLITDACRSGRLISNEKSSSNGYTTKALMEEWSNVTKFTSCQANQSSYEDEKWGNGHGVFTHFLLKGLEGAADEDRNNYLRVGELYDYVRGKVKSETNYKQIPKVSGNEANHILRIDTLRNAKSAIGVDEWMFYVGGETSFEKLKKQLNDENKLLLNNFYSSLFQKRLLSNNPKDLTYANNIYNKIKSISAFAPLLDYIKTDFGYSLEEGVSKIIKPLITDQEIKPTYNQISSTANKMKLMSTLHEGNKFFYNKSYSQFLFLSAYAILESYDFNKYDEAADKFYKILKYQPNAAYPYKGLSEILKRRREFSKSKRALTNALKKSPNWLEANTSLGKLYSEICNCNHAEDLYKKVIQLRTDKTVGLRELSAYKRDEGNFKEASSLLRTALEKDSLDAILISDLGFIEYHLGNLDHSDSLYQKSKSIDNRYLENHVRMSLNYRQQWKNGTIDLETYKRIGHESLLNAESLSRNNPVVNTAFGIFYLDMILNGQNYFQYTNLTNDKNIDKIKVINEQSVSDRFRKALEHNPYFEEAFKGISDKALYYEKDTVKAENVLIYTTKTIKSAQSYFNLFNFYKNVKNNKNATKALSKALKLDELNYAYLKAEKEWYEELGQLNKAFQTQQKINYFFPKKK